jgi:hypothetical protein
MLGTFAAKEFKLFFMGKASAGHKSAKFSALNVLRLFCLKNLAVLLTFTCLSLLNLATV